MTQDLVGSGLIKTYNRRTVVNGVDLRVAPGEIVGLLGPNGAGKTTTFYMMVGLVRPDGGAISLDGAEITHQPMYVRARAGLAYLPQEPSVFRRLSVEENIRAVLEILPGFSGNKKKQLLRTAELIDELNLSAVARSLALSLSGGERRRVEIARALACSPRFILLDEPFAGIDPIVVGDLQGIVRSMQEKGIGVLITDHNVRETLGICDRSYIISEGKVIESGTSDEIAGSAVARKYYLGESFNL